MNKEKHNEDGLTQMQESIRRALDGIDVDELAKGIKETSRALEALADSKINTIVKQTFNQRLVDITYRGKCDPKTKLEEAYYELWYYFPENGAINWFHLDPEARGPMNITRTEPFHRKYKQDDYQVCTVQSVLKSLIMLRALFKEVKGYCNNSNLSNALWAAAVGISHQLDPFLVSTFEPFGTMWWMSYYISQYHSSKNPTYNLRGNMCYSEWRFGKDFAQLHKDLMRHPVYSHWWLPMTDQLLCTTPVEPIIGSSKDVLIDWYLFRRGISIRANECSMHEWMNDLGKDIRSSVIDMEGKTL